MLKLLYTTVYDEVAVYNQVGCQWTEAVAVYDEVVVYSQVRCQWTAVCDEFVVYDWVRTGEYKLPGGWTERKVGWSPSKKKINQPQLEVCMSRVRVD